MGSLRQDGPILEFLLNNKAVLKFDDLVYGIDTLNVKWVKLLMRYGVHQLPTTHSGPLVNLLDKAVKRHSISRFRFLAPSYWTEEAYDKIFKMLNEVDKLAKPEPEESKDDFPLGLSRIFG